MDFNVDSILFPDFNDSTPFTEFNNASNSSTPCPPTTTMAPYEGLSTRELILLGFLVPISVAILGFLANCIYRHCQLARRERSLPSENNAQGEAAGDCCMTCSRQSRKVDPGVADNGRSQSGTLSGRNLVAVGQAGSSGVGQHGSAPPLELETISLSVANETDGEAGPSTGVRALQSDEPNLGLRPSLSKVSKSIKSQKPLMQRLHLLKSSSSSYSPARRGSDPGNVDETSFSINAGAGSSKQSKSAVAHNPMPEVHSGNDKNSASASGKNKTMWTNFKGFVSCSSKVAEHSATSSSKPPATKDQPNTSLTSDSSSALSSTLDGSGNVGAGAGGSSETSSRLTLYKAKGAGSEDRSSETTNFGFRWSSSSPSATSPTRDQGVQVNLGVYNLRDLGEGDGRANPLYDTPEGGGVDESQM